MLPSRVRSRWIRRSRTCRPASRPQARSSTASEHGRSDWDHAVETPARPAAGTTRPGRGSRGRARTATLGPSNRPRVAVRRAGAGRAGRRHRLPGGPRACVMSFQKDPALDPATGMFVEGGGAGFVELHALAAAAVHRRRPARRCRARPARSARSSGRPSAYTAVLHRRHRGARGRDRPVDGDHHGQDVPRPRPCCVRRC